MIDHIFERDVSVDVDVVFDGAVDVDSNDAADVDPRLVTTRCSASW